MGTFIVQVHHVCNAIGSKGCELTPILGSNHINSTRWHVLVNVTSAMELRF